MFPKGSTSALEHAISLGEPWGGQQLALSTHQLYLLCASLAWGGLVLWLNVLFGIKFWLKDFPSESSKFCALSTTSLRSLKACTWQKKASRGHIV